MKPINESMHYGLRDKETNNLMAVYPDKIQGNEREIENKVKFWYYQQSCSAEDELANYYVDAVSEDEINSKHSK